MQLRRSVHLPLPDNIADALYELSRRELRHPRQQAVWLLVEGLRRHGVLEDARSDLGTTQADATREAVAS